MLTVAPQTVPSSSTSSRSPCTSDMEEGECSPALQASSYSSSPPPSSSVSFASFPTSSTSSSSSSGLLPTPSSLPLPSSSFSSSSRPYRHQPSGRSSSTTTSSSPSSSSSSGGSRGTSSSSSSWSSAVEENPQLSQFSWTDFEIIQKVGEGTTGSVYKARHRPSSSPGRDALYALKVFRPEPDMGVSISALQEIKSFQRLKSTKHMVRFVGYAFTPEKNEFVLIEEYMEHDLAGLMHSRRRFTEPQIKCIMHQLLSGLDECHRMQLIHRDIKSSNILMHQGHVRITDFGFMTTVDNAVRYKSNDVVTLWYRPPEIILGTPVYGLEIDIWSIGCIFFELLTGEIAFRGPTNDTRDQLILLFKTLGTPTEATWPGVTTLPLWKEKARGLPPYPNTLRERLPRVSPQAFDLISSLLSLDPKRRPTTAQALAHPFFTHGVAPCKPADLPKFQEAHEYELKKAHAHRNGRPSTSGQPRQTGGALLPLPSGAVPGSGSGLDSHRRMPMHTSQHASGTRMPSRGPHQRVEEARKRPAPDVDWILNREKPSAKSVSPTVGTTSVGTTSRTQHEAKRVKTERDHTSPSQPKVSQRESSAPLVVKEERAPKKDVKPSPQVKEPTLTPSATSGASNGNDTPAPKAKLIQPLRKSSPTRRLPSLPMSHVPVRRSSETPAAAPPTTSSTPSSKITIRRSKVGDKPVLRIVTPGGSPPPHPTKPISDLPPASDAYREAKKRPHSVALEEKQVDQTAGQRHARKAPRTGTAPVEDAAIPPGQPMRKQRSSERPAPQPPVKRHRPGRSAHAGELYCTCQQPNDPSRWMIACDWCDCWYHGDCEGVAEEESKRIPKYKCRRCRGLTDS